MFSFNLTFVIGYFLASVTVILIVLSVPFTAFAAIYVSPTPTAVTFPYLSTVATFSLYELHSIVVSPVGFSGTNDTERVTVFPSSKVTLEGVILIPRIGFSV